MDKIVDKTRESLMGLNLEVLPKNGNDFRHLPVTYIYDDVNQALILIASMPVTRDDLTFLLYRYESTPINQYGELVHIGPKTKNILAVNPRTGTYKALDASELASCRNEGRIHICISLNSVYKHEATKNGPNQIKGVHDSTCLYSMYKGLMASTMQTCVLSGETAFNENNLHGGIIMVTATNIAQTSISCVQGMYDSILHRRNLNKRLVLLI